MESWNSLLGGLESRPKSYISLESSHTVCDILYVTYTISQMGNLPVYDQLPSLLTSSAAILALLWSPILIFCMTRQLPGKMAANHVEYCQLEPMELMLPLLNEQLLALLVGPWIEQLPVHSVDYVDFEQSSFVVDLQLPQRLAVLLFDLLALRHALTARSPFR